MKFKVLVLLCLFFFYKQGFSQDPHFYIYLCFGQSNMEGQGRIEEQDSVANSRFKVMQAIDCSNLNREKAKWYPAVAPLCQCYSGLSPVDYFGRTMLDNLPHDITIGVINVAIGGCDIRLFDKDIYMNYDSTYTDQWFVEKVQAYGGNPYHHLISLARQAQGDGVIKGILLHQGETNTGDTQWPWYVKKIYNDMLKDLHLKAKQVPLLAGEVVHQEQHGSCASMNEIIATLPEVVKTAHVVSSRGCTAKADSVHFNVEGYRVLGNRYAEKMLQLKGAKHK
ncbi:sialate O-acetylesterase [Saccharicrinis fermentans]|nr:sialate O-acetylesterase [Saccharicrinis fermentans]